MKRGSREGEVARGGKRPGVWNDPEDRTRDSSTTAAATAAQCKRSKRAQEEGRKDDGNDGAVRGHESQVREEGSAPSIGDSNPVGTKTLGRYPVARRVLPSHAFQGVGLESDVDSGVFPGDVPERMAALDQVE